MQKITIVPVAGGHSGLELTWFLWFLNEANQDPHTTCLEKKILEDFDQP